MRLIRTQIQLQEDQLKWIKRFALESDVSMSQAIRDCLDFYRSHIDMANLRRFRKQKALKAVGSFSSND